MKFCPECNNVYNIVRFNAAQIAQLAETLNEETPVDASTTSVSENESGKNKKEKIQEVNLSTGVTKYYFSCSNCKNMETITPGNMILSRTTNDVNVINEYTNKSRLKDMVNDLTLPHTRNYVCPNKTCKSHTDPNLRDAVWFKPSSHSYSVRYICTTCNTDW